MLLTNKKDGIMKTEYTQHLKYTEFAEYFEEEVGRFDDLSEEAQTFIINIICYDSIDSKLVNRIISNVRKHEARGDVCNFEASFMSYVRGEDEIILFDY